MNGTRSKLEQNLGAIVLCLLLLGCLFVLLPFVSALLWGVVLAISCWPAYERVLRLTGNRRTLASALMMLGMVIIILMPFAIVGLTLADNVTALTTAVRGWIEAGPPSPPKWLGQVPVVGAKALETWTSLASDTGKLLAKSKEWIQPVSASLLKGGLLLGRGLVELALSVLISFFLFRDGVSASERLGRAVQRISGERGQRLLIVAGKTVRGVVYGILGTALVQAVLVGIGLFIAGVPGAALLALLTFFFSVVPVIGTGLVWIPAAFWLFHQGSTGWAIFMAIWGLGVGNIDNFIKPWLISQGSDMPFILVFFGVIGGALTFGFVGVFLGPTLLAVGWRLIEEWASRPGPPNSANSSTEVSPQAGLRDQTLNDPKAQALKL
jgi:predicted PurR-regulated permease PerM